MWWEGQEVLKEGHGGTNTAGRAQSTRCTAMQNEFPGMEKVNESSVWSLPVMSLILVLIIFRVHTEKSGCLCPCLYPPHFEQSRQSGDVSSPLTGIRLPLLTSKTRKQWVKICSHDWWDRVVIMEFNDYYRQYIIPYLFSRCVTWLRSRLCR